MADLHRVLKRCNIESRYGVAALPERAHDASNPPILEFTRGRANVSVPFTSQVEERLISKVVYLFPCIDPLVDSATESPRMRYCVAYVNNCSETVPPPAM